MSGFDVVVKHVLVVIAMEAEASPLRTALGCTTVENEAPFSPAVISSVKRGEFTISVATNGKCGTFGVDNVCTVPGALTAFLAINQLHPDLVINAGTAGGFASKGGAIGDAYLSTSCKHHDRRIPIPGFTEYGIGYQPSHSLPNLVEAVGLKTGVVSTGNSLDHTETDDKIMLENDASCKDMEAAGVAWAASLSSTPFVAFKVVTDIVDGSRPSHEEFLENLHQAATSLQDKLPRVLDFVLGKRLSEL